METLWIVKYRFFNAQSVDPGEFNVFDIERYPISFQCKR